MLEYLDPLLKQLRDEIKPKLNLLGLNIEVKTPSQLWVKEGPNTVIKITRRASGWVECFIRGNMQICKRNIEYFRLESGITPCAEYVIDSCVNLLNELKDKTNESD